MTTRIPPRSGTGFILPKDHYLKVIDPMGEQVSDMLLFNACDIREVISSGRSLDYAGSLFLSTGDVLHSNRSRPMMTIVADDVGRHDFTLTPCSADTFRILYGEDDPHHGCQGNFERALGRYGIVADDIPVAFNIFMNVGIDAQTGTIEVLPPKSRAGDAIVFQAQMDLIVALTACSAGQSNNYRYKPIDFETASSLAELVPAAGFEPATP